MIAVSCAPAPDSPSSVAAAGTQSDNPYRIAAVVAALLLLLTAVL